MKPFGKRRPEAKLEAKEEFSCADLLILVL